MEKQGLERNLCGSGTKSMWVLLLSLFSLKFVFQAPEETPGAGGNPVTPFSIPFYQACEHSLTFVGRNSSHSNITLSCNVTRWNSTGYGYVSHIVMKCSFYLLSDEIVLMSVTGPSLGLHPLASFGVEVFGSIMQFGQLRIPLPTQW